VRATTTAAVVAVASHDGGQAAVRWPGGNQSGSRRQLGR